MPQYCRTHQTIQSSILNALHASQSTALAFPSSDSIEFNCVAAILLNELYRPGYLYKKAGVMIAGIEDRSGCQADLFAPQPKPEREKLMQTMDALNGKYGRGTVQLASVTINKDWRMSRQNLSPCYTMRLRELVIAG